MSFLDEVRRVKDRIKWHVMLYNSIQLISDDEYRTPFVYKH